MSDGLDPVYIIRAALWLAGIPFGLAIRFGLWAKKQPEKTSVHAWWDARLGANVISIALCVLFAMLWAEGSIYKALPLEKIGVELTYGLTPVASAAVAIFAHYILAAGKRRAEAAAGGPVAEED